MVVIKLGIKRFFSGILLSASLLLPDKILPTRLKTGDGVGIEELRSQGGRKGIESSFSVLYNEF